MPRTCSILALAALTLGVLGGCQSQHKPAPLTPLVDARGHRQSLAFNSPAMRRLPAEAGGLRWANVRNEGELSVRVGTRGPSFQSSHTRTIDRVGSVNGHVTDHYHRTTYRERHERAVH